MAKTKQKLFCKPGNHEWSRPAQRGRKPVACPQHLGQETPEEASEYEVLTCRTGNHTWRRKKGSRGRKPEYCPDHRPTPAKPVQSRVRALYGTHTSAAPIAEAGMEVLHCENGDHDWKRSRKKGKKPTNCPEHKNVAVSSPTLDVRSVESLRSEFFVDEESARIFAYIHERAQQPNPDTYSLDQAYKARLRLVSGRRKMAANMVSMLTSTTEVQAVA